MQLFFGLLSFLNVVNARPEQILAPVPESEVVSCRDCRVTSQNEKLLVMTENLGGQVLAESEIDLSKRWPEKGVNDGFRENILLALCYLKMSQIDPNFEPNIGGQEEDLCEESFKVEFELGPGEMFALHKNIVRKYRDKIVKTMESEFLTTQGYKSVSGLGGNGVCHLASLINWAASEAELEVLAPTDHGFAEIEGVPRKYWTSIRYQESGGNSQRQNLYVVNNKDYKVRFLFEKKGEGLSLKILKI